MVKTMKKASSAGSGARRCLAISVTIILVILVLPSNKPSMDESLRSGQAQHSTTGTTITYDDNSNNNSNGYDNNSYNNNNNDGDDNNYASDNTEEIRDTVNNAVEDIKDVEQEELAKSKTALSAAIQTAGDFVRIGLSKLLGTADGVTESDIDDMVNDVENRLTEDVNKELQSKADGFVSDEEAKLDDTTEEEEEEGMSATEIEQGVYEQEDEAIGHVKTEINEATVEMRKALRAKAQEAELEILQDRLSKRLGKTVKLMIIDDEISGVDELLADLSTLNGGEPSNSYGSQNSVSANTYSSGGSQSYNSGNTNSYGSGGTSSYSNGNSGGGKYNEDDLGE